MMSKLTVRNGRQETNPRLTGRPQEALGRQASKTNMKITAEDTSQMMLVSKQAPPGLILLQHEFGKRSNYHIWYPLLKTYAVREFGLSGTVVETFKIYRPERPAIPSADELAPEVDVGGFLRKETERKIAKYVDMVAECEKNDPKIFALILQTLSQESEEQDRACGEFDEADTEKNPAKLMAINLAVHTAGVGRNEIVRKREAKQNHEVTRQAQESLSDFKKRYYLSVKMLKAADCPLGDMTEEEMADDFLHRVNMGVYGEAVRTMDRDLSFGRGGYPVTVQEAYDRLVQWEYTTRSEVRQVVGLPSEAKTTSVMSSDTIFAADTEADKDKNKVRHKNAKKGKKTEDEEWEDMRGRCLICKKRGHYRAYCPFLKKAMQMAGMKKHKGKYDEDEDSSEDESSDKKSEEIECVSIDEDAGADMAYFSGDDEAAIF
jgi:hypothetical protein